MTFTFTTTFIVMATVLILLCAIGIWIVNKAKTKYESKKKSRSSVVIKASDNSKICDIWIDGVKHEDVPTHGITVINGKLISNKKRS